MTDTVNKQKLQTWIKDRKRVNEGIRDEAVERGEYIAAALAQDNNSELGVLQILLENGKFDEPAPSTPVRGYREALRNAADTIAYLMQSYPDRSWTDKDHEEWEQEGKNALNGITQALSQTDIQPSGEERVRKMYQAWKHNHSPNATFHLDTVLSVIDVVANIFGVDGINSTEDDQPGPSISSTRLMLESCPSCCDSFSFRKVVDGKCPWCGERISTEEEETDGL